MLVRFHSEVGGVLMFGEPAVRLIKLMGHDGVVPGALRAGEVQAALERLRRALAEAPAEGSAPIMPRDDEQDEPPVTLHQRALPLLELLEDAAAAGSHVMWERSTG